MTARGWPENLDAVYDEVNDIKHTTDGLYAGRSVTVKQAEGAAHELLNLFEAWNGAGRP